MGTTHVWYLQISLNKQGEEFLDDLPQFSLEGWSSRNRNPKLALWLSNCSTTLRFFSTLCIWRAILMNCNYNVFIYFAFCHKYNLQIMAFFLSVSVSNIETFLNQATFTGEWLKIWRKWSELKPEQISASGIFKRIFVLVLRTFLMIFF